MPGAYGIILNSKCCMITCCEVPKSLLQEGKSPSERVSVALSLNASSGPEVLLSPRIFFAQTAECLILRRCESMLGQTRIFGMPPGVNLIPASRISEYTASSGSPRAPSHYCAHYTDLKAQASILDWLPSRTGTLTSKVVSVPRPASWASLIAYCKFHFSRIGGCRNACAAV